MRAAARFALAALACGALAVMGSENLFWSAPRPDFLYSGWLVTVVAYALCAACGLAAVAWSGLGGWRGLFLGGAVTGFMVEGVLVDTMYDAFPLQLVWTPLAWHALVTALWLGGAQRLGGARGLGLQVAAGVALGVWAQYWPMEGGVMPGVAAAGLYLVGLGLVMPLAHLVLDRLGEVPRPHGAVLLAVPVLAGGLWLWKLAADLTPVRLALPVMVAATVWAMGRMGGRGPVSFGPPLGLPWRLAVLVVPGLAWAIAVAGWQAVPGGLPVNIPFALASGGLGLGLWLWCLWTAARQPSAASAARRSSAPS